MNKRLLIIAYYFPPLAASGSLRAAGFSRHISDFGFDPHILTVQSESAYPPIAADSSLESRLPSDLHVDRLEFPTRLQQLLRFRAALRKRFYYKKFRDTESPLSPESQTGGQHHRISAISDLLDRIFLFPDHQNPWIRATLNHVRSLRPRQRPEIILATGNPWSSLVAANRIGKQLNIPYIADFRDPWIDNPKPPQLRGVFTTAKALEHRVVSDAAMVVANTDELRQAFIRRYPQLTQKFVTISNGFERNEGSMSDATRDHTKSPTTLELSYFGSVSALRNPLELLRALKDVIQSDILSVSSIRIRFVGTWEAQGQECELLAEQFEQDGYLRREPPISHDACLEQMREADCLLILQQAFPLQIPAKVYEYISSRRPVLLIGGEGATKALVDRNQLGLTCPNDRNAIKLMLLDIISNRRTLELPRPANVDAFDYRTLTRRMGVVLEEALRNHDRHNSL